MADDMANFPYKGTHPALHTISLYYMSLYNFCKIISRRLCSRDVDISYILHQHNLTSAPLKKSEGFFQHRNSMGYSNFHANFSTVFKLLIQWFNFLTVKHVIAKMICIS